jgi:hypothetical protein
VRLEPSQISVINLVSDLSSIARREGGLLDQA